MFNANVEHCNNAKFTKHCSDVSVYAVLDEGAGSGRRDWLSSVLSTNTPPTQLSLQLSLPFSINCTHLVMTMYS